jgi:outer membrane protein assembly factor BamB
VYKYDLNNLGELSIHSALDEKYIFKFAEERLVESAKYKRVFPKKQVNGKFYISGNKESGTLYNDPHARISAADWKMKFIRPSLLFSNDHYVLVMHAKTLKFSKERSISLINKEGKEIWQQQIITTSSNMSESYHKNIKTRLILDKDNNFIIAITFFRFSTHYIALDKDNGDLLWQHEG